MTYRSAVAAIAVAGSLAMGLTVASPASADTKVTKIVLVQAAPSIVHSENSDPTSAQGDVTFYEATLTLAGKPFGSLSGTITTHDLVVDGANRETRLRTLIFELPRGQIVAQGASTYNTGPDFVPLDLGKATVIAITGGTGAFVGAKGELRTTRRADGTYRQLITLVRN